MGDENPTITFRQLASTIILGIIGAIVYNITSSVMQHASLNITINIKNIQTGSGFYPANIFDLLITLVLLSIARKINQIEDELDYINYKLYTIRRRLR